MYLYVSFLVWTQTLAHVYFFIDESVACCQLLFSVQVFKEELSPSTFCSVFLLGVERVSWGKKLKLVLTCLVKILRLSVAIKCNLSPTITFKSE